jgi:hypothetical protein
LWVTTSVAPLQFLIRDFGSALAAIASRTVNAKRLKDR